MVPPVAIGVLAGTVLLVVATLARRAGSSRPASKVFSAMAVVAGLHGVVAAFGNLTTGRPEVAVTVAIVTLALQAVVAGLLLLFVHSFVDARPPSWKLWLAAGAACLVGGGGAVWSGFTDDPARSSVVITAVPYLVAAGYLLRVDKTHPGRHRAERSVLAAAILVRLGAGVLVAQPWSSPPRVLQGAQRAFSWNAYLDAALLLLAGLLMLRQVLPDLRRLVRNAVLPIAIACFFVLYAWIIALAEPAVSRHLGASGAAVAWMVPLGLVLWAGWTWHGAVEGESAVTEARCEVRRDMVERVMAATADMVDAHAVLATVRASMLEVLDTADVQFRRTRGNRLLDGIDRTVPEGVEATVLAHAGPVVEGELVSSGEATGVDAPGGEDTALLLPVRRGSTLYGVFEVRGTGRVRGDQVATAAALADHLATKLENLRLRSSLGRAGSELADVKRFLEDLVESLPVGVVALVGPERRVRTWNPAEERRTGIRKEEAIGKRYHDVAPKLPPAVEEAIRGALLDVVTFPNVGWKGEAQGESVDVTVAPLRARGVDGEEGRVLIFADATLRTSLQREVEEYRRLAALGQLATAIAHEVRTPLSSIRMGVQILRSKVDLPEEDAEYFDLILESMTKLARQVDELLEFTRPALLKIDRVDVGEIVQDACSDLAAKARARQVSIVPQVQRGLVAPVDEAKLRQALAKLLCNAIEASVAGDSVLISAAMEGDEDLVLRVRDQGLGIDQPDLDRIWEPFFTTRPDGTGLGLPIVRKNVTALGGTIDVKSALGVGTTFEIRLPACRATEVLVPIEECRRPSAAE
jgi:PAS domain S-box-containing protein